MKHVCTMPDGKLLKTFGDLKRWLKKNHDEYGYEIEDVIEILRTSSGYDLSRSAVYKAASVTGCNLAFEKRFNEPMKEFFYQATLIKYPTIHIVIV